jgi:ketosteroid isomerase-like protein
MRSDAEATVEGVYRAWMLRDRDAMLAYFTDDAILAQHISTDVLPFAGTTIGKGRLSDRIDMVFRDWDFEEIKLATLTIEGDHVRCHVDFRFRYKPTGDVLDGRMRYVFHVEGGRIVHLDEYHDAPMIEAFMRLTQAGTTSN